MLQRQMAELETKRLTDGQAEAEQVHERLAAHRADCSARAEVLTAQGQIEGVGPKLVGDQMALELEYGKPGQQELDLTESRSQLSCPRWNSSSG